MAGVETIGAVASIAQLCTYISHTISSIRTAFEDVKNLPGRVQQQIDNLQSLSSVIESIRLNHSLQTPCVERHLEHISKQIISIKSLLLECLRKVKSKPLRSFWYCLWTKSQTEDQVHSAFKALESSKSNLQLFLLNIFGETVSHLDKDIPNSAVNEELMPFKKEKTVERDARRGEDTTSPQHLHKPTHEIQKSSKTSSGNDKSDPEPSFKAKSRYAALDRDGQALPDFESNAKIVYYATTSGGDNMETRYGNEYENAPSTFSNANQAQTTYVGNTSGGSNGKTSYGSKIQFSDKGKNRETTSGK